MSFTPKRILMKTFVDSQFENIYVYEFQTNANSDEDICWVSVWSYLSLRVSNKNELLWRHLVTLSLKLCKFTSFKEKRIPMKTFVQCQFEVITVYEFQAKPNSYERICSVSVWSYVSLSVSNKSGILWRYFLRLSLELCKFMSFKLKWILTEPYFRS